MLLLKDHWVQNLSHSILIRSSLNPTNSVCVTPWKPLSDPIQSPWKNHQNAMALNCAKLRVRIFVSLLLHAGPCRRLGPEAEPLKNHWISGIFCWDQGKMIGLIDLEMIHWIFPWEFLLRPRKKGGDFYGIAATLHGLTSQDFVSICSGRFPEKNMYHLVI